MERNKTKLQESSYVVLNWIIDQLIRGAREEEPRRAGVLPHADAMVRSAEKGMGNGHCYTKPGPLQLDLGLNGVTRYTQVLQPRSLRSQS